MGEDCIFCKIARGEIPSYKILQNEQFMAFLDINPNTKGHSLVIPKKHFRWTYDVPDFGEYFEFARQIAILSLKGLGAEWVSFATVGVDIPHAHIHVMPRYKDDGHGAVVDTNRHEKFTDEQMAEIAEKLRSAL